MKSQKIDKIVCMVWKVKRRHLRSKVHIPVVNDARNAAMYFYSEVLGLSSKKIAKAFNRSSHSTILSDLKRAGNLIETDSSYRDKIRIAQAMIDRELTRVVPVRKKQYNTRQRLSNAGVTITTKKKQISLTPQKLEGMSKTDKRRLQCLNAKYGFSIQLSLL